MIIKPAISFIRTANDAVLLADAQTIVNSLTANASYPSPTPTLAAVATAINEYMTALSEADRGGTERTALKNARRAALGVLLRELASYVQVACKGDMAVLLGSGFPIQKPTRTPAGVLPAPNTPFLTLGARSGELDAETEPLDNAYTYNWRVSSSTNPEGSVRLAQTTAASTTFTGLMPGQSYIVTVNAVGSAGPSDWSNTAEAMVV